MKIEGVKDNYIMMAKKELEACNWLITGELETLKRAGKTCYILSGWTTKEAQMIEKLQSDLNQLKFHEEGEELHKVTYRGSSIVTRAEYGEFVEEYTKTIRRYWVYAPTLCAKLNDLLRCLSQAM